MTDFELPACFTMAQQKLADVRSAEREQVRLELEKLAARGERIEALILRPKKTHITLRAVVLAWVPV